MTGRAFTYLIFLLSLNAAAEPFTPADNDIIAPAQATNIAQLNQDELMFLLLQSQQVGKTELRQGLLKNQLQQRYTQSATPQLGYMYARVLQREHQFSEALAITKTVLQRDPNHINTHLLRANMLMVQGEFKAAKKQCLKLIGLTTMDVVNTCTLDVLSQDGQLAQSYQSLKNSIVSRKQNDDTRHVLAEMALRLNKPDAALSHIQSIPLASAPVSLVVLWADIQLTQGNYQTILTTLPTLVTDKQNLEDALLLSLAIAEQYDNEHSGNQWRSLIAQRVALRELRQDRFHASDLAHYYLDINKQPAKALYWAEINWQQAKLEADQQLLTRAQGASQ